VIEVDQDSVQQFTIGKALILSTLFLHECKLSVMHFKIHRNIENTDVVPTKTLLEVHCGFRKYLIKPTFSLESQPGQGDKLKALRFLRSDIPAIASAFCPIIFSPCKILVFTPQSDSSEMKLIATGNVLPPNPL
jgi:pre-rRNA-processing protein TSR1